MYSFEVGKTYGSMDYSIPHIKILQRTQKTCMVINENGTSWRMMIRSDGFSEYLTDSSVPKRWRECYTYYAKFADEEVDF